MPSTSENQIHIKRKSKNEHDKNLWHNTAYSIGEHLVDYISLCILVLMVVVCYLSGNLPSETIHQLLDAVVCEDRRVEDELWVRQLVSINKEAVGHQGVPVVELAELQSNAVAVLKLGVKQHGGIKLQLQQVSTEVLHVLLYHDFDGLTWERQKGRGLMWRCANIHCYWRNQVNMH